MPLTELHSFIRSMDLSLIKNIQEELLVRLEALINIGLSYLTLGRATETLSGGEAQRIKIAKYVNSALNDIMYILDDVCLRLYAICYVACAGRFLHTKLYEATLWVD